MRIKRVKMGESNATEYTYDNGEVYTIVDNPLFNGSVVAEGPKHTIKWEMFDFGAPDKDIVMQTTKQGVEEFDKVLMTKVKEIPEVSKGKLSQFGIPYFSGLEIFLEDYGFQSTPLPWRYQSDRYIINQVEDSDGDEEINPTIYGISVKSDEERVYRGRLLDSTHAAYIFGMVAERRLLTGKDDFPKLPIEPVKFEVTQTSFLGSREREIIQGVPAAIVECTNIVYGNELSELKYRAVKTFYTAQELLDYAKLVKKELVISRRVNLLDEDIIEPKLEIYDDYRE